MTLESKIDDYVSTKGGDRERRRAREGGATKAYFYERSKRRR